MNFLCDKCNTKVSFWETLKIKQDHATICVSCGTSLYPVNIKSFNWGFGIGFIALALPGKIVLWYTDDFFKALTLGLICGVIAVFCIAFYTYKTTKFKSAP